MKRFKYLATIMASLAHATLALASDIADSVEHRYADNDGVKIHYAVTGTGPLVVMIHGFPDFWYSWRDQMAALADRFTVAAVDQRGYNLSGQPDGVAAYAMPNLVADIAAVIAAEGKDKAIVVGHDWGGAVAWNVAMTRPQLVDLLVILNLPHPNGLARELRDNPDQQRNSQYARNFQQPDAYKALTAEGLAGWVTDDAARPR
jgi:pimeloyl-ACP methyl ester carboxylesterase